MSSSPVGPILVLYLLPAAAVVVMMPVVALPLLPSPGGVLGRRARPAGRRRRVGRVGGSVVGLGARVVAPRRPPGLVLLPAQRFHLALELFLVWLNEKIMLRMVDRPHFSSKKDKKVRKKTHSVTECGTENEDGYYV